MKSPFWTYFHDKLNWLPIFRPGPVSVLMRGLALHMDEVRQDILWLREQWNPATCELWLLERYGASRGIFRTRFDTDESYRKRVIYAYAWHKLGGKVRGLESIYGENGFQARVSASLAKELWAHFRMVINVSSTMFGPEAVELCFWIANEYKAARSVLEGIWTHSALPATRVIGAIACSDTTKKIGLWFAPVSAPAIRKFTGATILELSASKHLIYQLQARISPFRKFTGMYLDCATVSRISFWRTEQDTQIN